MGKESNWLCELKGHMWYFCNRKDVMKEDEEKDGA